MLILLLLFAEPQLIPLDKIWAHNMPQTREVYLLKPADAGRDITRVLRKRAKPGAAFVVAGKDTEALLKARDTLSHKAAIQKVLPAYKPLTLVFHSSRCGRYVRINAVLREGNQFTIKFQMIGHMTLDVTSHFALIPIGKLTPGKYNVQMQFVGNTDPYDSRLEPVQNPFDYVCAGNEWFVE